MQKWNFNIKLVLADSLYGESGDVITALEELNLEYIVAIRSNHTAFKLSSLTGESGHCESRHCDSHLSSGTAMPHARIEIVREGRSLPPNEVGQVVVHSEAIAQSYYQNHYQGNYAQRSSRFAPGIFYTDDLGYLTSEGHLHITGRASRKIISGGENISPAEVEAALRTTQLVKDVCVLGQPDNHWGEIVVAIYVPTDETVSPEHLKAALRHPNGQSKAPLLSRYKHPKRWIACSTLPRNVQGKLNHSRLLKLVQSG